MKNSRFLRRAGFCLFIAGLSIPATSKATDLEECMAKTMQQASDTMTIGELRLDCQKQISAGTYASESCVRQVLRKEISGLDAHNSGIKNGPVWPPRQNRESIIFHGNLQSKSNYAGLIPMTGRRHH